MSDALGGIPKIAAVSCWVLVGPKQVRRVRPREIRSAMIVVAPTGTPGSIGVSALLYTMISSMSATCARR